MIPEWHSFRNEFPSRDKFVLHRHDKIDGLSLKRSSRLHGFACARSDTHVVLAPNYKEQQLMISLTFSISLGVPWAKSQSMLPSIYFRIRRLQSSFLLILFRYSPISCSQKLPQNVAKNLKTVKIEKKKTKQNKTKRKKNTIFWNLKTIDPSNFEVNQIEAAKIIFKRAFQASSVSIVTVVGVVCTVAICNNHRTL